MSASLNKCQENLKHLYFPMMEFAAKHAGLFPGLDSRLGIFAPAFDTVYPDYITHLTEDLCCSVCPASRLVCPDDTFAQNALANVTLDESTARRFFDASSYWYFDFFLPSEDEGLVYANACRDHALRGEPLPDTITLDHRIEPGTGAARSVTFVYRNKVGIERFHITDIRDPLAGRRILSHTPLFVEKPGRHAGGSNVLYMDGHVEFVEYPGKHPMTEAFVTALLNLENLRAV